MLLLVVAVSAVTVSAIGAALAAASTQAMWFGLMAIGPCLAVGSARPRAVAAISGYALILIVWICTAQGLWSDSFETQRLLPITCVCLLCVGMARSRQLSQEQAAKGRARLAEIVRSSGDAIITMSPDGTITEWNPAAERIYGYTAREAVGSSVAMLGVTPDELSMMARLVRHQRIDDFEIERKRKDGSPVPLSASVAGLLDHDGEPFEVCVTHRDLTAKRSMEARERVLSERSAQAERLESLGRLAGGVAHDFNNLLAIILNYTDFAIEQGAGVGTAQDDLARVRGAADRARLLCRQLLIFARSEPTESEAIDLNLTLADSRDLLAPMLGEHIELTVRRAPEPLMVQADRTKLDQVLLNLIINARDAMPHGRPPVAHGQHVLVVEDDEDVRDLVARILQEHGYAVTAAADGPVAMQEIEHKRFNLLLTDVIMPTMPGTALAALIQQSQPGLPVLFISGYTKGLLNAQHAIEQDMEMIQKPFTADELLDRIHHLLTARELAELSGQIDPKIAANR
ncbi:response regulator [Actinoplanes sp. NPDC049668]|uniref:hybrid sensor histidine kinase/response regulator n=1 Tax=unclassified Actinoplanes TaxID=2626549 RepID=UPI0033BED2AC